MGRQSAMQYGLFTMPSHPPERSLFEGHRWDLQTLRWADELGFVEAWIGEHHTAPWEPHPAPDLLIAQALMETRRIRLAPGGASAFPSKPGRSANRGRDAAPRARYGARRSRPRQSRARRPSATFEDPNGVPRTASAPADARAL